jgi:pimeloyl-ACP methyl ester carboxylesterase
MNVFLLKKDSINIRYIDVFNESPVLVFLHGLGSSSIADFSKTVMNNVSKKRRCILIDLPGHGFSDKPKNFGYSLYDHAEAVAALLDNLKIKKSILIGHSLGGNIAIALTQKRPDLVSKLVILEPNLDPGIGQGSKIIASQPEQEYLSTGHQKYLDELRKSGNKDLSYNIYSACFSIAEPIAIYRSAVGLLKGTNPPQRDILRKLKIPRFFIVGEKNINQIPLNELTELGLKRVVIKNAGHAMMHDNPTEFYKALEKIIKS